jgi:hypothetical protein
MPRIDPTVTKEAKAIYDDWEQGEKGTHVSIAILEYEKRRNGGLTLTEADKKWIRKEILKMKDKIHEL